MFYWRGWDFFIAGAEPGLKFFHCRDRGWAGIKNFEMTGAGSGLEKLKMPGPGRDQNFFITGAGLGFKFFIAGAEAGPGLKKFYCWGRAGIYIFLLPGPGRDLYFFFFCRSRGRAGIKNFEMTWAGPGLEKLKIPGAGPSQDRNYFFAGAGPASGFFYCRGRTGI